MATAREVLLERIVTDVAEHGIGDRSLRDLAAAVGSSHRMLLYHFGSRGGLVASIVESVERSQREVLRDLATETDDPHELVRLLWARVSAPELRPFVRLFFEALATAGEGGSDRTAPWLDTAEEVTGAVDVAFDPVDVRLGVAVTRGLLVDVLMTGDEPSATAALERFLELWQPHAGAGSV
jgi:AcrR family transcriptional regulator